MARVGVPTLKAHRRNSWRQGEVFSSGNSDFDIPVSWPVAQVQISLNFLGEVRVDVHALEKPKRERKRRISFNTDINDLSPRRGSSSQRLSPRNKKGTILFDGNIRSRLLPHLQERSHHREKPDPRLRWAKCVRPLFVLGVSSVAVAVALADARLVASDVAIALAAAASVSTGILAMVAGGLSLSARLPPLPLGERPTWLTRQRREQQRQLLVLLPGALLVAVAVATVLRHGQSGVLSW